MPIEASDRYRLHARGAYVPHPPQRVLSGPGRITDLGEEARRVGARRVLIVTSPSVALRTTQIDRLRATLGEVCVGVFDGVQPHSPVANVADTARMARQVQADALASCGGGSAIDVAKGAALMLAAGLGEARDLEPWFADSTEAGRTTALGQRIPHLAVPTTSSGAEFTGLVGLTQPDPHRKRIIVNEGLAPDVVVLDPTATLSTPTELWLSSAVRALDHGVEALYGRRASPFTETLALRAVALLFDALPRSHDAPSDIDSRGATQIATWHATWAAARAGTALSHGLGYVLGGSYGVPHGLCSCATLAAVMRWNREAARVPLALIARASGRVSPELDDWAAAGAAAEAVHDLVGTLELPRRLRDVGAVTYEDLDVIAKQAMGLPHVASNPRMPGTVRELRELLETAW